MADEIRLAQESIDAIADAMGGRRNSAAPSPTPAPAPAAPPENNAAATSLLNTLIQKFDALITAITGSKTAGAVSELSQVAIAVGGLKDASNLASGAITNLAGKIPIFGTALEKAGVDLNEYLKIARAGNQQGVGQGNAADLQERAIKSGFKNVQDYLDYLKESYNNSLRTIGKSAEDSSQKLGLVQQQTLNSQEGQNMVKRGLINPDQLAKIVGIAAEGKSQMLQSAEGRKQLAEEAGRLALKIEAQTKITGESTDKIIADNRDRAATAEEQLRLQSLTNDNQRLQYTQNQQMMAGQGKSMQDVMATIYTGGRLTKDQQSMLQTATGGRGGQLIQLIREQKRTSGLAAEDPRRIEADKRLKDFTANMNAYQSSPEFARRANTTSNEAQRRDALTIQRENKEKGAQQAVMNESKVTPAEANRRINEIALQQGRGYRQEGLTGKEQVPNVGARPYETLFEANEQARKTVGSVATEINKLNNSLGRNTEALDGLRTILNPVAGPKGQTQEERDAMVRERIRGKPGNTGAPAGTDPATGKPKSRAHGTKGETGLDAEPKDAVLQIHKGETVLTPEQKDGMIKDSANSVFDKILGKKNDRDPANQDVRYKQVDPNDPAIVKMREERKAEEAERAKYTRTREVSDPMYKGGKRWETYDIREEEAKQKEAAAAKITPPEVQKQLTVDVPKVVAPTKPAQDTTLATPKVVAPAKPNQDAALAAQNAELKKYAAQGDTMGSAEPGRIRWKNENGKLQKTYENQAEKMLSEQTQGAFGNLRTAVAKRQQQTGPNITDEFKNYQPKATITPAGQEPVKPAAPKIETKENVTLKDLNDQLMMLNKSIAQLVQSSTTNGSFAEQQIRATKKLSGNRFG